jgi:hypothetical protein
MILFHSLVAMQKDADRVVGAALSGAGNYALFKQ